MHGGGDTLSIYDTKAHISELQILSEIQQRCSSITLKTIVFKILIQNHSKELGILHNGVSLGCTGQNNWHEHNTNPQEPYSAKPPGLVEIERRLP
jgi:hypothetical protein